MNRHRLIGLLLMIVIATGLHTAMRGLGGELHEAFPLLAREEERSIPFGMESIVESEEETPAEPPVSVTPTVSATPSRSLLIENHSRKLLSPSRFPDLPPAGVDSIHASFAVPPALEPIVNFWKKIYGVYSTDQVVLHDSENLQIIYGVLDFTDLKKGISDAEKKSFREARVSGEMDRIRGLLRELDLWSGGNALSPEAREVAVLFQGLQDPRKFRDAQDRLRSQIGLKNRFLEGLKRSGRYMALFEPIFQAYGVPKEISRLAFVESLFKERAYSKVGAAGLWQFMPDTARHYMAVNRWVDERYDPVMAAAGAAQLLLKNYAFLGTWPLAINAYNSGPGNLQKAMNALGTRDIARIITEYRGGSYAFASRNFYPCFLAALSVYENHDRYFEKAVLDPPMAFDLVSLPTAMTFPEIAYLSQTTVDDLHDLNPSYADDVLEGSYSLPPGAQVRLPRERQPVFAARFVNAYSPTAGAVFHIVRPQDSLQSVASRYGVTAQEIQKPVEDLKPGDVLMISSTRLLGRN